MAHAGRRLSIHRGSLAGVLCVAALGAGCDGGEAPTGTCALDAEPELVLLRVIHFALADDAGVSLGFDLDGDVSTENGASGCGIGDYVEPNGKPGIDNAFSRLVPALDATEAKISAIEGLLQSVITSGELLLTVQVGGVDDWTDDDCVAGEVGRAAGTPMLGTDGLILDGQTFDRDEAVTPTRLDDGRIRDGVFEAGGLDVVLPVQILNANLALPVEGGRVRLERSGDDAWTGLLAGRVSADVLLSVAQTENIDPAVADLLAVLLVANVDMPDGDGTACAAISVTLQFEAVGAYYYEG
jgi:hypothetical protein